MSVYKEKNDKKWKVEIRAIDSTGKAIRKRKSGFNTKKEAVLWEQEFLNKLASNSNITFKTMWGIYLEDCRLKVKDSTIIRKIQLMNNYILPIFGNILMNEINTNHIRNFQNELLGKKLSKNTLRIIESQAKCVFNFAVKYYNLESNPMSKVKTIGSRKNTREFSVWGLEEFQKFISVIEDMQDVVFFSLLFWTGMRVGEAIALNIKDVDFEKKKLNINKTVSRSFKGDIITKTKTESSIRKIALTDKTLELLKKQINRIYKPANSQRLFDFGRGYARKRFLEYIELSKVKKIRMHDLRHSHASFLIQKGVNILAISKRLGHEDIKMTLNTYAHLYEEENKRMIDILNKI